MASSSVAFKTSLNLSKAKIGMPQTELNIIECFTLPQLLRRKLTDVVHICRPVDCDIESAYALLPHGASLFDHAGVGTSNLAAHGEEDPAAVPSRESGAAGSAVDRTRPPKKL